MIEQVDREGDHETATGWDALQAAVVDNLPLAVYRVDLDGVVRAWNRAAEHTFGWSADEAIGMPLADLVSDDPSTTEERLRSLASGETFRAVETVRSRRDGSRFASRLFAAPVRDAHGHVIGALGLVEDVDVQRRAERAVFHSHELMRHIIEHDPNAIAVHDRDLNYVYVSQRYLDDYGVAERDVIGRHHYEVFPDIPDHWREIHRRALAGEVIRSEESRFERADGSVDWTRWECRPWYDEDDQVGGIILYTEVITAQKQLEDRLRHAQKMELVGQLAGGIAHDYRNVLQVVLSQAELALDEAGPDDPLVEYLDAIREATLRSIGLTRQLMTLARRQSIDPEQIDVASAIEGSHDLLQRLLGRRIHLEHRPAPGRHDVLVDPSQFDQVLVNLCVNARDAIEDRDAVGEPDGTTASGNIVITTRTERVEATDTRHGPAAIDGEFVVIEITDDGCGMDAETRSRLFEPFFTTKPTGRGTGLGLATVYGIVGRHGGFLHVSSEPGVGSTFRVYLPHQPPFDAPAAR